MKSGAAIDWQYTRLHTRTRGRVASLSQIFSAAQKKGGTNQIAAFKCPLNETLAKPQANKWQPAKKKKEYIKIQMCFLQAAQEVGYSYTKLTQVEVILNFVRG